jgi:hypothetical protein
VTTTFAEAYTVLLDIIVTGFLLPRRWDGEPGERSTTALTGARRWGADTGDTSTRANAGAGRWKGSI